MLISADNPHAEEQNMRSQSLPRTTACGTDPIDLRILRVLADDGRIPMMRLAEQVHLSATAVAARVHRLQHRGVIRGFRARLNPHKLGLSATAFARVQLDRTGLAVMERFAQAVREHPWIVECHLIAGAFDYLIKVVLPCTEDADADTRALLQELPGVRDIQLDTSTRQLKQARQQLA